MHQDEFKVPRRPLGNAALTGSFVCISAFGVLSLSVSLLVSLFGFAHDSEACFLDDEPPVCGCPGPIPAIPAKEEAKPKPNPVVETTAHAAKLKRRIGASLRAELEQLIKSKSINGSKLVGAYLDFESRYIDADEAAGQARVHTVTRWLKRAGVEAPKKDIADFLTALQLQLMDHVDIQYNRAQNLVSLIEETKRLQCQSASVALALASLSQSLPKDWTPIFVHSYGHVQFGILRGDEVFVVESTGLTSDVLHAHLREFRERVITHAKLELLESMAFPTQLTSVWHESPWSDKVVILDVRSQSDRAPALKNKAPESGPGLTRGWGISNTPDGDRLRHHVGKPRSSDRVDPHAMGLRDSVVTFDFESIDPKRITAIPPATRRRIPVSKVFDRSIRRKPWRPPLQFKIEASTPSLSTSAEQGVYRMLDRRRKALGACFDNGGIIPYRVSMSMHIDLSSKGQVIQVGVAGYSWDESRVKCLRRALKPGHVQQLGSSPTSLQISITDG